MKLIYHTVLAVLFLASSLVSDAEQLIQSSSSVSTGKLIVLVLAQDEARVPDAKVIIESKGFKREMEFSPDDVSYKIDLPEGKYKVSVSAYGFRNFVLESVAIKSNDVIKLTVNLEGKEITFDNPLYPEEEVRTELDGIIDETPPKKKPVTKP